MKRRGSEGMGSASVVHLPGKCRRVLLVVTQPLRKRGQSLAEIYLWADLGEVVLTATNVKLRPEQPVAPTDLEETFAPLPYDLARFRFTPDQPLGLLQQRNIWMILVRCQSHVAPPKQFCGTYHRPLVGA